MADLDFYFDFRSPYAYLAQTQLSRLGVTIAYRPFDASDWPVRPSGLLGPVRLMPMREKS